MSLRVGAALADGLDDLLSERGALVLGLFVLYSLLNTVLWQSASSGVNRMLFAALPEATETPPAVAQQSPLALDVSFGVAVALLLVFFAVGEALRVVAIRAFAADSDTLFAEAVTEDLGGTVLTAIAAAVVTTLAVALGTLLFVLPGLLLAFLFFFVRQEVALNDSGVVAAIRRSIDLVTDNAVPLLALAVVLFVLGVVVILPTQVLSLPLPSVVVVVVTTLVSQVLTVFGIAVVTSAYQRVTVADDFGVEASIEETF